VSLIWMMNETGAWEDHLLNHDYVEIASEAPVPCDAPKAGPQNAGPLLVRTGEAHGFDRWVLLCPPVSGTRVNGSRVNDIRVLTDRDAIAPGNGHVVFFSSEQLAEVQPFPGKHGHTSCIRCKLALEAGSPAVRCPAPDCGFWHHHAQSQSCWTYTSTCASCGHPTDFEAGYQWSPSEL